LDARLKALFVCTSQLAFPAGKVKIQKQEQTTNFSVDFCTVKSKLLKNKLKAKKLI
jgi:hypothetical protein